MKSPEAAKNMRLPAPSCAGKRFALVVARFYPELTDWMIDGARRALAACGVAESDITCYELPGCFELPLAAQRLIQAGRCDAVVALGVVIRGETPHFDFVAGECSRGLMDVQLYTGAPIGFGILTTDTFEQAQERADPARGDKGFDAAFAAACVLAV
ncbi:MAG TPA: 6,7-dimethyl-8-ribityllumazine synthase [Candidatus Dormibacteraeota bacterium]|nr:6,7-dimethyl-8-ribityllumazine synthase [Candidatus Dormibacteraeota bacterium]